jgi:hypothetical protein
MTDLFVFVVILAVVIVGGLLLGIILAGRIDRIQAPGPAAAKDARTGPRAVPPPEEEDVQP